MKFLISNDDGVNAPGLLALYQALSDIGEVKVVAPDTEQSGCASAISISAPLYPQQTAAGFIALNGSPADCVYLALHELYCDMSFDCVITGINSGANLGQDVLFSGTFGAALTAQLFGVPAIATSLVGGASDSNSLNAISHYDFAAAYHVLNVNIPDLRDFDKIRGRKLTCLSHDSIEKPVHRMADPRGRNAYWLSLRKFKPSPAKNYLLSPISKNNNSSLELSTALNQRSNNSDIINHVTDTQAVANGFVSLSPVKLHHTPATALKKLSTLEW